MTCLILTSVTFSEFRILHSNNDKLIGQVTEIMFLNITLSASEMLGTVQTCIKSKYILVLLLSHLIGYVWCVTVED